MRPTTLAQAESIPRTLGVPDRWLLQHTSVPALLQAAFSAVQLVQGEYDCRHSTHLHGLIGWGRKPSSHLASQIANERGLPLWRIEDAFLRSLRAGPTEAPLGLVLDNKGIYYDATEPSRLETLIQRPLTAAQQSRARDLIRRWREQRVSKYNQAREAEPPQKPYVLVVDQTAKDLSITLGQADPMCFNAMLEAALQEHPHCRVVVKSHPEVASGKKIGHFSPKQLRHPRVQLESQGGHPVALLEQAQAVYVVTSQLGFEALIWGKPVHCFGMPFYAGWGLTSDALPRPQRRNGEICSLEQLVHAALIDYAVYVDPHRQQRCEAEELMEAIGAQRRQLQDNPTSAIGTGFLAWKRQRLELFIPGTIIRHSRWARRHAKPGRTIVTWGRRHKRLSAAWPGPTMQVEDGFLRSVGLGAERHVPISWAVDYSGIYFDATGPSDLETWLATCALSDTQRSRAAQLRQRLVAEGISKYNLAETTWQRPAGLQRVVLVIGQVEEDASIRYGAVDIRTNLDLLKAARQAEPEAFLIYKPHPDVMGGHRRRSSAEREAHRFCDLVLAGGALPTLLEQVDSVHVITSLSGFEALLRGVEVHTWGLPFYAGWGLTQDAHACPRRGRALSLDALVFGALIAYPRYVSRRNGWLITAEQAVDELVEWRQQRSAADA